MLRSLANVLLHVVFSGTGSNSTNDIVRLRLIGIAARWGWPFFPGAAQPSIHGRTPTTMERGLRGFLSLRDPAGPAHAAVPPEPERLCARGTAEDPEEAEEAEIVFEDTDFAGTSLYRRIPGVFRDPTVKVLKVLKNLMVFRITINRALCTGWANLGAAVLVTVGDAAIIGVPCRPWRAPAAALFSLPLRLWC